ncbi:SH3 domain-containing protein [Pseudooceanicola sp.]|uniref:SH3 domain-containing protein n=1 Tax=Pseudooceanicola sp. TaxID=1914328 RepID=UPI0035C68F55
MRLVLALLLLLPGLALAQSSPYPALYDVARVAADDVLNVREKPDAGSRIIGTLAPDQTGIEVAETNDDRTWAQINAGEQRGWVSLAYLERQPGQEGFPAIRACFGAEPFWALRREGAGWLYSAVDQADLLFDETWSAPALGRLEPYGMTLSNDGGTAQAVIRRELCSDGMSDRIAGLTIEMILTSGRASRLVTGCCSLTAP